MNGNGTMWLPPANSTLAPGMDILFYFIYYCSIIVTALVTGAIILFIVRYRRRGKAGLTSGVDHNLRLEIVWTIIPTIVVFIIFGWGFKGYLRLFVIPADSMEVKVTGQKWFWTFDYPEGTNSVNELVVPISKPIKLLLSSKDVIHSFFVPNFRIKMDVLPNRYTQTWFEATDTGQFNIFCSEYCGTKHSAMIGKVKVVSDVQYAKWLETGSGSGEGMSLEEYGAKLYTQKACVTCHSIDGKPGTAPSFKGIFGEPVTFADGTTGVVDENYIRQSVLEPQAKIVRGYLPLMPTFQGILKDRQIDALVAYIKSLRNHEGK